MPTFKSGNASLSVWNAFSRHGHSPLVSFSGTLNQFKYIQILNQYVLPRKNTHESANLGFIYQHDGRAPHRAKRVVNFLDSNGVNVLPWPAQSPDLNRIENFWVIMKQRLHNSRKYPSTADEIYKQLCQIWNELSHDYFTKLSHSIIQCCKIIENVSGCLYEC